MEEQFDKTQPLVYYDMEANDLYIYGQKVNSVQEIMATQHKKIEELREDNHKAVQQLGSKIHDLQQRINKAIDILKNDITAYISKKPFDETIPRVIRILQGSEDSER